MLKLDIAELKRPIQTLPENAACGDKTFVLENENYVLLALIDGAGHGPIASRASDAAVDFLIEQPIEQDLCETLSALHEELRNSRGAVADLCRIDKRTGVVSYSGIGNVTSRIFKPEGDVSFFPRNGMLGYEILPPKAHQKQINPGEVLILYSDGVRSQLNRDEFPAFFELSAYDIARITIDYFSKTLDDASCIVVKVADD
jgi:phosphoserine phosphatase RsbX